MLQCPYQGSLWTRGYSTYPYQSSSEYTVLSCSADNPHDYRVDFQVEAIFCYLYDELAGRPIQPLHVLAFDATSC